MDAARSPRDRHLAEEVESTIGLAADGTSKQKQEADGQAGDAALRRMAEQDGDREGGYAEAGEKVGDKGVLSADVRTLVSGRMISIPKGTQVAVSKVKGEFLVVKLPSGQSARIPSSSFEKSGGGGNQQGGGGGVVKPEPTKPTDPMKDPKSNPDPTNEYAKNATYSEVKGVVAVKGEGDDHEIAPNDVEQGSLGDCYFVAQLAAQAKTNPGRIKDLIKDNGDGTYTVSLFLKDPAKPWQRQKKDIVVDGQFPHSGGSVAYAKPGDRGEQGPELWVMLIEKAFAKHTGSFEGIRGSKTKDGDVFAMMSGEASSSFSPAGVGEDKMLERLAKAVAEGKAVSFGAKNKDSLDEKGQAEAKEAGVVLNHAYALEGVDQKGKTVSLRNPWGVKHLTNFAAEKVIKFYSTVDIAAK